MEVLVLAGGTSVQAAVAAAVVVQEVALRIRESAKQKAQVQVVEEDLAAAVAVELPLPRRGDDRQEAPRVESPCKTRLSVRASRRCGPRSPPCGDRCR